MIEGLMNNTAARTFGLPQGWTLRQVATALARQWLPPFRAIPVAKGAPWMVQPIVEESVASGGPLWEPGISTEEFEARMNRIDLNWAIRAKAGRGKGTILARLAMSAEHPAAFQLTCSQESIPASLFDADKLARFTEEQGGEGADGLFGGLLVENGFRLVAG
ncbi:MAG: hypothetical protein K0R39_4623 [Symbiobacteriaceae bacterium]|nr:hypothetical protein [Symbiobacteriaceae bacterium]